MSVELACGKCQGRFLVAAPGTVACPHCGIHLSVTADAFPGQTDDNPSGESSPLGTDDSLDSDNAVQESEKFQNYAGLPQVAQSQAAEPGNLASPPQPDSVSSRETENHGEPVQPEDLQADVSTESIELPIAVPVSAGGDEQPEDASAEAVDLEQPDDESPIQPAAVNDTPDSPSAEDEQQALSLPDDGLPTVVPHTDSDLEAMTITVAEFNKSEKESPDTYAPAETFESLPANTPTEEFESSVPTFGETTEVEIGPDESPDFSAPPSETGTADIAATPENADDMTPDLQEQPAIVNDPPPAIDEPSPSKSATGELTQETIRPGVSRQWFLILASYASAMTIVCLWLLLRMMSGVHQLENLNDPAEAPARGKKKVVRVYPVDLQLPRGHELQIGDRRQYGHIVVEPLRVSRGRLDFVRFDGEQGMLKESTAPVLKLWLRFENVSDEQTIAPLDSILLYSNRIRTKQNYEEFHANNFVVGRDANNKPVGKLLHVYDMNTNDVWDLKDQQLDKKLKPGESCVIYVPTSEKDIDKMNGGLVWRLHFRKGYSPSNRGVTTLIDIKFDSSVIQNEAPQPAGESTASL